MKKTFSGPFWLVVLIAIAERLTLWLAYPPVIFDDTNSYRRLAGQIMGTAPFDGTRSPGYPIFLAWLGPDQNVYAVQLLIGLATVLLFFYLGWAITGKTWAGAAAALAHTLNLGQLFFEADLLAETLTTFLALATICGGIHFLQQKTYERSGLKEFSIAFLTGISGGLAAQARPQFVFLPFLVAFFIFFSAIQKSLANQSQEHNHEGHEEHKGDFKGFLRAPLCPFVVKAFKTTWIQILVIAIPAIIINAIWVNYLHTQFGVWSMSSDDGYHIIQHTGKFFEYVPNEYAAIRDTFLKYRAIQIAETGRASNTIWAAIPELKQVSGLGFYKLSHKLQEISAQLIREHPLLYLGSVLEAWTWFWSAPFYWDISAFGAFAPLVGGIGQLQRILLWGANAIFIAGTLALVIPRVRKTFAMPLPVWMLLSIVWVNAILQALVEASENPRYSVSTQTLVVLVVGWWIWHIIQQWHQHNETR